MKEFHKKIRENPTKCVKVQKIVCKSEKNT